MSIDQRSYLETKQPSLSGTHQPMGNKRKRTAEIKDKQYTWLLIQRKSSEFIRTNGRSIGFDCYPSEHKQ